MKQTTHVSNGAQGHHQIFQEVIVEDEDEHFNDHMNLNSSGLATNQFNLQNHNVAGLHA